MINLTFHHLVKTRCSPYAAAGLLSGMCVRAHSLRKDFLNSPFDILECSTALASECLLR